MAVGGPRPAPSVTAVVVAYGDDPWLERCVASVLASEGVDLDLVVVDNGCTSGVVDRIEGWDGVTVLRPGRNLGFAGGCNAGAARAGGDVVALLNQDATVAADALAELAAVAAEPGIGAATASVRLADDPRLLNSAGNPVHVLGFSWAEGFGQEASGWAGPSAVASASGAAMAMRRDVWRALGGFPDEYFAYGEDLELSIRCWQRKLEVRYVPSAVVVHRYEFSRNPRKLYLLERNRLISVLTLYQARTLALLAPALLAAEVAMAAVAARQGWFRQKAAGWGWAVRHRRWVTARRRAVQAARLVPDRELRHLFTATLDPAMLALPAWVAPANRLLASYWAAVSRAL
ncbi:MAG: glycosyltransferase family 2 protein [Acidimicrobiales bacterium]